MTRSFTYDGDLTVNRNLVRFEIGDTDGDNFDLSDEEIDGVLTLETKVYLAAARCADHLSSKYARLANFKVGDVSKNLDTLSKKFADRAKHLRARSNLDAVAYAPAIYVDEKETLEDNTNLTKPQFRIGQFDSYRAGDLARRDDDRDDDI